MLKAMINKLFTNKKCKTCIGGCDKSIDKCEKKCRHCMRQSKVADVKRLANEMPESYMGVKEYVLSRLVPQMFYYGTESLKHKRNYMRWTISSLAITGIIPVVSMFTDRNELVSVGIALLSSLVTFLNAYLLTTNSKNTWILYRETRERLFNKFYEFYGEFTVLSENPDECNKLCKALIEDCEKIMMTQMDDWIGIVTDDE